MSEVKRYSVGAMGQVCREEGAWVRYEDYAQQAETIRKLREALEAIIKRVALVSPYYEIARAALAESEQK